MTETKRNQSERQSRQCRIKDIFAEEKKASGNLRSNNRNESGDRSPHRPFEPLTHERLTIFEKSPDEKSGADGSSGDEMKEIKAV